MNAKEIPPEIIDLQLERIGQTEQTPIKHMKAADAHFHRNEHGVLVKCYHRCKSVLADYGFWLGMTIGFPFEHFLWEKVWPFNLLKEWMGL